MVYEITSAYIFSQVFTSRVTFCSQIKRLSLQHSGAVSCSAQLRHFTPAIESRSLACA